MRDHLPGTYLRIIFSICGREGIGCVNVREADLIGSKPAEATAVVNVKVERYTAGVLGQERGTYLLRVKRRRGEGAFEGHKGGECWACKKGQDD